MSRCRWLFVVVGLALCSGATTASCARPGTGAGGGGDDAPLVVATTTQLADFARVLTARRVRVHQILVSAGSPHDHELTPADLEAVAGAAVVVHNGLGLETFWEDLMKAAEPRGIVVDASHGVPVIRRDAATGAEHDVGAAAHEHAHGEVDPHIWHDPTRAVVMVRNLTQALVEADPAGASHYRRLSDAYVEDLGRLDVEISERLSTLDNPKLVTSHDAFGYYIDRYDLTFVGAIIPSFDSRAELSADDVTRLVDRIRAEDVRAVFSESDVPAKTAQVIAEEAGVRVVAGEEALYGDALGPPGSGAETYLAMMRHNTEVIVDNLT